MRATHPVSAADRRTVVHAGLGVAALGLLTACAGSDDPGGGAAASATAPSTETRPGPSDGRSRTLLVFFSRAGENYYFGDRIDLEVGNTAVVAQMVADLVDVDVFEIKAADPYPEDYEATVQRNVEEQDADARPQIAGALPDVSRYDAVMLGSGVWNVQAPMIMRTFVESVDLTGRTILPFVTYAVSGMGRVADDYERMLPGATVTEGLAVRGEEAADARPEVEAWLRLTGLID